MHGAGHRSVTPPGRTGHRAKRTSVLASRATRLWPGVSTLAGRGKRGASEPIADMKQASFDMPAFLSAPFGDGTVAIVDERNHTLRRLQVAAGAISSIATQGSGKARAARQQKFSAPVCIDGQQGMLLLDRNHHKLLMVQYEPSGAGSKSAHAAATQGTGVPPLAVPRNSPAVRAARARGEPLTAKDFRLPPATTTAREVAGTGVAGFANGLAGRAQFRNPSCLAVLPDGSVLVADTGNHAIRRLAGRPGRQGLFVTTIAGCGEEPGFADGEGSQARFNAPVGLAVDSDGVVLVTDSKNHAVRVLVPPPAGADHAAPWAVRTLAGGRVRDNPEPPPRGPGRGGSSSTPAHTAHTAHTARLAKTSGASAGTSLLRGGGGPTPSGGPQSKAPATGSSGGGSSGVPGFRDGPAARALLRAPHGLALLHVPRQAYERAVRGEYLRGAGQSHLLRAISPGSAWSSPGLDTDEEDDGRSVASRRSRSSSRGRSGSASRRHRVRAKERRVAPPAEDMGPRVVTVALIADSGNGAIRMLGPALNITDVGAGMLQGLGRQVPFAVRFAHVTSVTGPVGVPGGTLLPADVARSVPGLAGEMVEGGATPPRPRLVPPSKAGYADGAAVRAAFRCPMDVCVLPHAGLGGGGVPPPSEYLPPLVVVSDAENHLLRVLLPGWALSDAPPPPLQAAVHTCLVATAAGSPQGKTGVGAKVPSRRVASRDARSPSSMTVFVEHALATRRSAGVSGVGSAVFSDEVREGGPTSPPTASPPRSIPSHMWLPHVAARDKRHFTRYSPDRDALTTGPRVKAPPPNSTYFADKVSPSRLQQRVAAAKGKKRGKKKPPPAHARQSQALQAREQGGGVAPPEPPPQVVLEAPPPRRGVQFAPDVGETPIERLAREAVEGGGSVEEETAPPPPPPPPTAPASRSPHAPLGGLDALALANALVEGSMEREGGAGSGGGDASSVMTGVTSRTAGGSRLTASQRALKQYVSDFSLNRLSSSFEDLQARRAAVRKAALERKLAEGPRPGVRDVTGEVAVRVAGVAGGGGSPTPLAQLDAAGALAEAEAAAAAAAEEEDEVLHMDSVMGSRVSGRTGGAIFAAALEGHLTEDDVSASRDAQYAALLAAADAEAAEGGGGDVDGGGSAGDAPGAVPHRDAQGKWVGPPGSVPGTTAFAVAGTESYLRPTRAFKAHGVPSPATSARARKEAQFKEYRAQRRAALRRRRGGKAGTGPTPATR